MDYSGKIITKNPVEPSQTSAPGVWTLDQATQAVQGNNWPIAYVPNPISRSLRFNTPDAAYLNRTFSTPTAGTKWTYSLWMKKCGIAGTGFNLPYLLCTAGSGAQGAIGFGWNQPDDITFVYGGYGRRYTPAVFRDYSAWYHLVFSIDTTQGTEANRAKLYVNGVQQTWTTNTAIGLNDTTQINQAVQHNIGRQTGQPYDSLNAYLAETYFIDGSALDPTYFGMTDPRTGAWIPKKYSGTYGTNGFYLNFSDNSTTAALGTDSSGNNNTWTTNGFSVTPGSGNDSMTDVPTPWIPYNTTGDVGGVVRGNYATWNPVNGVTASLTNGNLDLTYSSAGGAVGTMAFPSSGKWYWEVTVTGAGNNRIGICLSSLSGTDSYNVGTGTFLYVGLNGNKYTNGSASSYGATYTANDIIGVAVDADAGTVVFYKNNSSQGTAFSGLSFSTSYSPTISVAGAGTSMVTNFGQRPFAYTPPAGFKSLCTTNLPEPTILDGGDYFNTVLYTGNGSTQSITGVGFQPDLVWAKCRSNSYHHKLVDAVRGATLTLSSSQTSAEQTETNSLTAFNSDGFSLGSISSMNASAETFVAWNWKANGSGSSNTAGTIPSTVSANQTAGFSIVTYTGDGNAGATFGHGLGAAPSFVIVKERSNANGWLCYHVSTGNTGYLELDATLSFQTLSTVWNNTSPTSTLVTLGTVSNVNRNGGTFVAYCFAAVPGFSAFGSYTGNGSTDGPFIYCGFRPSFILTKRTDSTSDWQIIDTSRSTYNVANTFLFPNLANADSSDASYNRDILSNGFKIRASESFVNANGGTFIYAAFAENPFKYSNAR